MAHKIYPSCITYFTYLNRLLGHFISFGDVTYSLTSITLCDIKSHILKMGRPKESCFQYLGGSLVSYIMASSRTVITMVQNITHFYFRNTSSNETIYTIFEQVRIISKIVFSICEIFFLLLVGNFLKYLVANQVV